MFPPDKRARGWAVLVKVLEILTAVLTHGIWLAVVIPIVAEGWATRPPIWPAHQFNPLTELGLAYEDTAFEAADGLTLRGWFIPAASANAPAIVYAHGAGRDQRSGLSIVPALHQAGYSVLLFSYRDHGCSDGDGRGITYGYHESQDVDSAVRFLCQVKQASHVGVIGYSVGGSSVLLSAARNPDIEAVVAVAPFADAMEIWMANRPAFLPHAVLNWMRMVVEWRKGISLAAVRLTDWIRQIAPRPLLLIQGSRDERIPLVQVQQLFAAAGQPKDLWLIEGETHESIYTRGLEARLTEVTAFFDRAFRSED